LRLSAKHIISLPLIFVDVTGVTQKILTGCRCIDESMGGGLSAGSVNLVYGEPETGKSTLAMQCAVHCALQGLKVLFVDCDGTFSPKRLEQLSSGKFDAVAELVILVRPVDFREQTAVADRLSDYTAKGFGLVVIDTVTGLYRARVAETSGKAFGLNRELNRQMANIAQMAKTQKIPVIVTSQVHGVMDEDASSVAPVATRVLKFWADEIIAMKPTEDMQIIKAVLEETPKRQNEVTCYVRIRESGLQDCSVH
jgi:RecA/RadA recombinase